MALLASSAALAVFAELCHAQDEVQRPVVPILAEAIVFIPIPVLAAAIARGYGLNWLG